MSNNTPTPAPEYEKSIQFLRRFHPGRRWILTAITTDKKSIDTATFDAARQAEALAWLNKHGAERNIYFSVAEVSRDVTKKAERTDIARVWWLHVDIDPRAGEGIAAEQARALKLLQNPPGLLPPTVIVFSGGGYQAFWALREPIAIDNKLELAEDAKRYNLHIEVLLGADNVHNVDRIMRLPGTVNRPDPTKVKKGRTAALATLVEWTADRVYTIDQFSKAPEVRSSAVTADGVTRKATVNVSAKVKRLASVDELPAGVTDYAKVIICQGFDPDEPNKFPGRSEWLFLAVCEMVRGGCDDDQIYSVITDPAFGISASVLDKGSMTEKYALRQIERAKEEAIDPWLRRLNERHAVIRNWGGKCRVIEEQLNEATGRYKLTKQSFDDFRNAYMHTRVPFGQDAKGKDITLPLGEWWLRNEYRRQYNKIVFCPEQDVPEAYNLWRGFVCPARPGDCGLYLDHLKANICKGNEDHYRYLVGWMARAVQKPGEVGHSAVVLRGKQGTGKGMAIKPFGKLFARHFMHVTNPKHLIGNFNAHLHDCVVLFGDEAFYARDAKHESLLKVLITEETLVIEPKGVDSEISANCVHLMMSSNEEWVVPVGADDRRFFILDVADARRSAHSYFKDMQDQLDGGGREALLHHLMHLDISDFNVRDVPKTDEHRRQKDFSMSPADQWVTLLAETGMLPGSIAEDPATAYSRHPDPMHNGLYEDAKERVPELARLSDVKLSRIAKEFGAVPWSTGAKRGWTFPPLKVLRAKLEEKYGPRSWPGGAEAEWRGAFEYAAVAQPSVF